MGSWCTLTHLQSGKEGCDDWLLWELSRNSVRYCCSAVRADFGATCAMSKESFAGLLPLLLLAVVVFWFFRPRKRNAATADALTPEPVIDWPEIGGYEVEVTGESHYQHALQAIAGEHGDDAVELATKALLVPDDANPYDNKAVKVLVESRQVGHLSRDDARSYRRRLAAKKQGVVTAQCGALVMGGFIGRDGKRASYGVRLDLKPFE